MECIVRICEMWNDGYLYHAPVGSFEANGFGLYDMLGNVSEWCRDTYRSRYEPLVDEPGDGLQSGGTDRVFRGGSWYTILPYCRAAFRNYTIPSGRNMALGVRVALSVPK